MQRPTREELAALRGKYEEMARLRRAHDAGEPGDPRRALAALASEFPGALREIDDLPLAEIDRRVDALRTAEADASRTAPWMTATILFHALTRGALCAKKWLGGRKRLDADGRATFDREADALCWAADAREWAGELDRLADPPRGRVTDLVYAKMAARLGVTPTEARILVFGLPRRERAKGTPA